MSYLHRIRQHAKDQLRRRFGVDVVRFPLYRFLEANNITLVMDIGANRGQFTEDLYKAGYKGRVVSFEPIPEVFHALQSIAGRYKRWDIVNTAIGCTQGNQSLRVTTSDTSSSFYSVDEAYAERYPQLLSPSREISVAVDTLDHIMSAYATAADRVFVKLDVQGAELDVIVGGSRCLASCYGMQAEMSLVPIYDSAPVIEEVITKLRALGLVPVHVRSGFKDSKSWRTYDCDITFLKAEM